MPEPDPTTLVARCPRQPGDGGPHYPHRWHPDRPELWCPGAPWRCEHGVDTRTCEACAAEDEAFADSPPPPCRYCGHDLSTHNGPYCMQPPTQAEASEQRFGPHRVIGEFSGDPSCAVCHRSWPCPTATQSTARPVAEAAERERLNPPDEDKQMGAS